MYDRKGVSLVALVVTIIVIIIIASITILASSSSIDNANETKFKNDLKSVVTALDIYNQQAYLYGVNTYNSSDLTWDGTSERAENTAKIEDKTSEDRIKFILSDDVPNTLQGKMTIENGAIKIDKNYGTEYEWAVEMYSYMEY